MLLSGLNYTRFKNLMQGGSTDMGLPNKVEFSHLKVHTQVKKKKGLKPLLNDASFCYWSKSKNLSFL